MCILRAVWGLSRIMWPCLLHSLVNHHQGKVTWDVAEESENSSGLGTSLWITVGKMLDILKQTHSCSLYFGRSQKHILRTNQCHGRTGVARPLSCFLTSSQNSPHLDSVISVFQRGKRIYPQKSVDNYVISFK